MDRRTQPFWGTALAVGPRKVMVLPLTIPAPHVVLLLVAVTLPLMAVHPAPIGGNVYWMEPVAWLLFWTRVEKVTVELGVVKVGAIMYGIVASVNVHDAVSCEVSPVAVARNVAPLNSWEKMYQLVSNSPFWSATTVHGWNDCWMGSVSTTIMSTVSPGWKPLPWK